MVVGKARTKAVHYLYVLRHIEVGRAWKQAAKEGGNQDGRMLLLHLISHCLAALNRSRKIGNKHAAALAQFCSLTCPKGLIWHFDGEDLPSSSFQRAQTYQSAQPAWPKNEIAPESVFITASLSLYTILVSLGQHLVNLVLGHWRAHRCGRQLNASWVF